MRRPDDTTFPSLDTPLDFENRQQFVDSHRWALYVLVDGALAAAFEADGLSPGDFRFESHEQFVEWVLEQYCVRKFDVALLKDRTVRLFTKAHFWFAQRNSKQGFRRLLVERQRVRSNGDLMAVPDEHGVADDELLNELAEWLGLALAALQLHTCNGLVSEWLYATRRLMKEWFGAGAPEARPLARASKGARSRYGKDAMFRYQLCLHELVELLDERDPVREWLFTACSETPPFRNEVAQPDFAARRRGVASLISRVADVLESMPDGMQRRFACMHAAKGFTDSLLHSFSLDNASEKGEAEAGLQRIAGLASGGES